MDDFWDLTKHPDLEEVVGVSHSGEHLTIRDIKTIQPGMPEVDKMKMRQHSKAFKEGWLNDTVRILLYNREL